MPVKDHIYCNNAKTLKEKVKTMLNNAKYADTMFLVNDETYQVSSHLVAVSSTPLETVISTHFDNCGDREIKIRNIKHSESFNIILKCIYGIEINLTRMNAAVLYEVLCLCESYELVEFATEIKTYLTKMEEFKVNSVVALLNTAKKFNLKEVYERLTRFAYKNTKKIVKHSSFKDLHYDVLIDLLPSDWFYAKEIDILRGVLTWHSVMYNEAHSQNTNQIEASHVNDEEKKKKKNDMNKSGNFEIYTKKKRNNNRQSEVFNRKTEYETVNTTNDETRGNNAVDDNDRGNNDEDENPAENNLNNIVTKIDTNIVKTFSNNVLKSLLAHVRISQISILELNAASELEVFKKYKTYFSTSNHFSLSLVPRCQLISETCVDTSMTFRDLLMTTDLRRQHVYQLGDFSKTFTVDWMFDPDELVFSDNEYSLLKDLNLCVAGASSNTDHFIYVACDDESPLSKAKWQCTGECQVILISSKPDIQNLVLPSTDSYRSVMFTPTHSQEEFEFKWPSNDLNEFKGETGEVDIRVQFKSVKIKLQEI